MSEPLCGTFNPSIDSKGRMSFPNKLRDVLGAEFYLCMSHDGNYIAAYSIEEFEIYCNKLYGIPGDIGADIRRDVMADAEKQVPDKQGRIFISQHLRERAGITGEVTVIGNLNRAEIWASDKLAATRKSVDPEAKKAALANLVL
ncbi:MAG: division/cell wall cluster transcriptional repressor MraZ [Ruminococcus sp.]|nr:division/cell wall cluster transcriptional repressor MraZ [Ruminococcus sp.]